MLKNIKKYGDISVSPFKFIKIVTNLRKRKKLKKKKITIKMLSGGTVMIKNKIFNLTTILMTQIVKPNF